MGARSAGAGATAKAEHAASLGAVRGAETKLPQKGHRHPQQMQKAEGEKKDTQFALPLIERNIPFPRFSIINKTKRTSHWPLESCKLLILWTYGSQHSESSGKN